MFTTLSLLSFLFIGCGEDAPKEETKTEEQVKAEAVETAKKEIAAEAKKKEEEEAKKEAEKEALKEEIKKDLEEEAKKKEEEAKKAAPPKKKVAAERSFTVRVSVDKKPMGTRPKRIDAEAKKKLEAVAKKAGYSTMIGNLSYKESKADCSKGNKCIRTATATFKK